MNILIVGCGKVGSRLASYLSRVGHDVSIIDRNPENFDGLDNDFTGFTVAGVPIDQDVLREAGIEACDTLAALTQDDNTNIMVSEIAKELFHVPKVLARVYDPARVDIFAKFGITTICPTDLTVTAVSSMLLDRRESKFITFGSSVVSFSYVDIPPQFIGRRLGEVPLDHKELVLGLLHEDELLELRVDGNTLIREGDRMIFATLVE